MPPYNDPYRRGLIPIDPNDPMTPFTGPGPGGGVVPGVAPVPGLGQRLRTGLKKAGRGIMSGDYDFPDVPASLPYRPNTLTTATYGLQGLLEGFTRSRQSKEAQEERTQRLGLEREKTELGREQVRIQRDALTAQTTGQENEFKARIRAAQGQAAREASAIASKIPWPTDGLRKEFVQQYINTSVGILDGSVDPAAAAEHFAQLSDGLQIAGMSDEVRALYANNLQIEMAKGTPEKPVDPGEASKKAIGDALKVVGDAASGKYALQTAQIDNLKKTNLLLDKQADKMSRDDIRATIAAVTAREESYLRGATSLLQELTKFDARFTSPMASILGGDFATAQSEMASIGPPHNPDIRKAYDKAFQMLENMDTIRQKLGLQADWLTQNEFEGLNVPVVDTGEGDEAGDKAKTKPVPGSQGLPAMLTPPKRGDKANLPSPQNTSVDVTNAFLKRGIESGDTATLRFYVGKIGKLTHPETGADLSDLTEPQRVEFVRWLTGRYGVEAASLYVLRQMLGDKRIEEEYGTLTPEAIEMNMRALAGKPVKFEAAGKP